MQDTCYLEHESWSHFHSLRIGHVDHRFLHTEWAKTFLNASGEGTFLLFWMATSVPLMLSLLNSILDISTPSVTKIHSTFLPVSGTSPYSMCCSLFIILNAPKVVSSLRSIENAILISIVHNWSTQMELACWSVSFPSKCQRLKFRGGDSRTLMALLLNIIGAEQNYT